MRAWLRGVLLVLVLVGGVTAPAEAKSRFEEMDVAVLQWLDKVTARLNTVAVPVGTSRRIETLTVKVYGCRRRPPRYPPESAAFIKVWEDLPQRQPEEIFSGWMFASSPSLNPLEHPTFDVWLIKCVRDNEVDALVKELKERQRKARALTDTR